MEASYQIVIKGFESPVEFVNEWSKLYSYTNEGRYVKHIDSVLDNKTSFVELFRWKNGTGDVIYEKKLKVVDGFYEKIDVLRKLRNEFDWELFEKEFEPTKSSAIWKIFLLHLINPNEFPIFDQHVYRFYNFYKNGIIEEIPSQIKLVYQSYKREYKVWFNEIQQEFDLTPKLMDMSFFTYGQLLKRLNGFPIEIK